MLTDALQLVIDRHLTAIFDAYSHSADAAKDTVSCVKRVLQQPTDDKIAALSILLRSYRSRVDTELSNALTGIQSSSAQLKNLPTDANALRQLVTGLNDWKTFSEPLQALENQKGREEAESRSVFGSVRSLSIELANDHEQFDVSLKIIKASAETFSYLPRASSQLVEDLKTLENRTLQKELLGHLNAKRRTKSLSIIRELLNRSQDAAERDALTQLQNRLLSQRNSSVVSWMVYGGIVIFIGFVVLSNSSGTRSYNPISQNASTTSLPSSNSSEIIHPQQSNLTSPSYRLPFPQNPRADSTAEEIPPIGFGRELSLESVRYCEFQQQRLELARSQIDETSVEPFNAAIADWNSRCSSFKYLPSDRTAVEMQLITKQDELRNQANHLVVQWRAASSQTTQPPTVPHTVAPPNIEQAGLPKNDTSFAPPIASPSQTEGGQIPNDQLPPPLDIKPTTPATSANAELDGPPVKLLNVEYATSVQKRLADLGFYAGALNGNWGHSSRLALRSFKVANALSNDDLLDDRTSNALYSPSALHGSIRGIETTRFAEATYPPPSGAAMNPLNQPAAARINGRLRELGLYKGKNDSLWSGASRSALKAFKAANRLTANDIWDAATEKALLGEIPR